MDKIRLMGKWIANGKDCDLEFDVDAAAVCRAADEYRERTRDKGFKATINRDGGLGCGVLRIQRRMGEGLYVTDIIGSEIHEPAKDAVRRYGAAIRVIKADAIAHGFAEKEDFDG